jgi:hypothetical protein
MKKLIAVPIFATCVVAAAACVLSLPDNPSFLPDASTPGADAGATTLDGSSATDGASSTDATNVGDASGPCPPGALFCATFDDPRDAGGLQKVPQGGWTPTATTEIDAAYEGPSGLRVRGATCLLQNSQWVSDPIVLTGATTVTVVAHARRETEIPSPTNLAPFALKLLRDDAGPSDNLDFYWTDTGMSTSFPNNTATDGLPKSLLNGWQTYTWTLVREGSGARMQLTIERSPGTPTVVPAPVLTPWPRSLVVFVYGQCGNTNSQGAAMNFAYSLDSLSVTAR